MDCRVKPGNDELVVIAMTTWKIILATPPRPESCQVSLAKHARKPSKPTNPTNEKQGGGAPTSASPTGRIKRMRQRVLCFPAIFSLSRKRGRVREGADALASRRPTAALAYTNAV